MERCERSIFFGEFDQRISAIFIGIVFSYRNFRTYTSPTPVQFSCIALDVSGEVVCAGGFDTFNIFVWSIKTGKLLDVKEYNFQEKSISGKE